jgi:hypothetical protein
MFTAMVVTGASCKPFMLRQSGHQCLVFNVLLYLYSSVMFMLVAHSLRYFWHSKLRLFCVRSIAFILKCYHNAVVTAQMHSIEENLCCWHGVLLFYELLFFSGVSSIF